MIRGIGVDILQVSRMRTWLEDRKLLERFFHEQEIAWCLAQGEGAAAALAARFAAREAYAKALGTGLRNLRLRDVWVSRDAAGRPLLMLEDAARKQLALLGEDCRIHLSLSHERDYAVAMVVIE